MRTLLVAASVLAFSAGAATAALPDFSQLDANKDSQLSKPEFRGAFSQTPVLSNWDANNDQALDKSEFHNAVLDIWDRDENDQLSQQEVEQGVQSWLDPNPANVSFSNFDADNNGSVGQQELQQSLEQDAQLFGAWDQNSDGKVGAQELHDGMFEVWDTNNDNTLAQTEYEKLSQNSDWIS